jgi:hypothetical protein
MRPKRHTAYHESGHFVVGTAAGLLFREVNILPGPGGVRGSTIPVRSFNLCDRSGGLAHLAWTLAGAEAERRYSRRSVRFIHATSARGDIKEALAFAEEFEVSDEDLGFGRWLAFDAVKRHWPAVEAVASALLSRLRLTGTEALAVAVEAWPDLLRSHTRNRRLRRLSVKHLRALGVSHD